MMSLLCRFKSIYPQENLLVKVPAFSIIRHRLYCYSYLVTPVVSQCIFLVLSKNYFKVWKAYNLEYSLMLGPKESYKCGDSTFCLFI